MLPVLPNSAGDISIHLKMCPTQQRNAFLYTYGIACGKKLPAQRPFNSYGEFEDYVWSEARQNPVFRTAHENIVWLWIYLFMLVNAEDDLSRVRSSGNTDLGKDRLIKMSVDLGRFVIKKFKQEIPPKQRALRLLSWTPPVKLGTVLASLQDCTVSLPQPMTTYL